MQDLSGGAGNHEESIIQKAIEESLRGYGGGAAHNEDEELRKILE
jgi:hypothetical protein